MNNLKMKTIDLATQNFTKDITKSKVDFKKELPKYWNKEYIIEKIDSISNYKHKMLVIFLWYTGLRITEAISVKKENIDFVHYIMTIKWQKNKKYSNRIVPLHPELKNMLEMFTAPLKADNRIFAITRQRAWQITKQYLRGHPHQLRHSFAVNWLRGGGDIITLSRILGHSHIQNTMEYLKIVPNDIGKELIKISFR